MSERVTQIKRGKRRENCNNYIKKTVFMRIYKYFDKEGVISVEIKSVFELQITFLRIHRGLGTLVLWI